jgi:hypothetical protein
MLILDQRAVNRTLESEVLLVDADIDGGRLRASGCVPSSHSRMPRSGGRLPGTVAFEIMRQAGFALAHELAEIPNGQRLFVRRSALAWRRMPPALPAAYAFWFDVTAAFSAGNDGGLSFEMQLLDHDRVVASGTIGASFVPTGADEEAIAATLQGGTGRPVERQYQPLDTEHAAIVSCNRRDPFLASRPDDEIMATAMFESVIAAESRRHRRPRPVSVSMRYVGVAQRGVRPVMLTALSPSCHARQEWVLSQGVRILAHAVTHSTLIRRVGTFD